VTRRRNQRALTSPVLVGALTVLVTVVAVVLAFQANNGLPFVPRYDLHVEVPDAQELTRGAEVHLGGALIGAVTSVDPVRDRAGRPVAELNLALQKSVEPLPVDTTFTVRQKDAIGEKFLAVAPGHATRTWPQGATVPLGHAGASVDLDQVLSMFTPPTRKGVADTTTGFGAALAGRGTGLNAAIHAFVPLVTRLTPVMRNLAAPKTGLAGFFRGLGAFSAAVAPVAIQQADLYRNLDATFETLAPVARPYLQEWISQTPPTFTTAIADSPSIAAFAGDAAGLFRSLRPGFATLPQSAPVLADAFAAGTRNLPGSAALDRRTVSLAHTLQKLSADRTEASGLDRVTLTAHSLISPLSFLTPVQSSCNYVTLFLRNAASALSDPVGTGTALRVVIVAIDDVLGGEGVPAQKPYETPGTQGGTNHAPLHSDPYPNTDSPGQAPECSAGNEPFSAAQAAIGNPAGNVGTHTETTTRSSG